MASTPREVTQLLIAWRQGDQAALASGLPLVFAALRQSTVRSLCQEQPAHTLQAAALVHETYLQLLDQSQAPWQNHAHFFGGLSVEETGASYDS